MVDSGFFGVGSILEGKKSEDDNYFKVLNCNENSTDEQINAEYRVLALKCHPDKHPGDPQALDQFQKLQEAKDTLLDPEKRAKYEKWRQSEICIPYKQWLGMSNRCATTMHWAKPKDQTMLQSCSDKQRTDIEEELKNHSPGPGQQPGTSTPQQSHNQTRAFVWQPEKTSSVYSKFRNYKI